MKVLWIKQPYLEQILAGDKTVEVRVGYKNIRRLREGDQLKLNDQHVVTIWKSPWLSKGNTFGVKVNKQISRSS